MSIACWNDISDKLIRYDRVLQSISVLIFLIVIAKTFTIAYNILEMVTLQRWITG